MKLGSGLNLINPALHLLQLYFEEQTPQFDGHLTHLPLINEVFPALHTHSLTNFLDLSL
jgi:hypothetical protein